MVHCESKDISQLGGLKSEEKTGGYEPNESVVSVIGGQLGGTKNQRKGWSSNHNHGR